MGRGAAGSRERGTWKDAGDRSQRWGAEDGSGGPGGWGDGWGGVLGMGRGTWRMGVMGGGGEQGGKRRAEEGAHRLVLGESLQKPLKPSSLRGTLYPQVSLTGCSLRVPCVCTPPATCPLLLCHRGWGAAKGCPPLMLPPPRSEPACGGPHQPPGDQRLLPHLRVGQPRTFR